MGIDCEFIAIQSILILLKTYISLYFGSSYSFTCASPFVSLNYHFINLLMLQVVVGYLITL